MALSKVTYADGETVIGATNLNDIQDEIISQETGKQDTLTEGDSISIEADDEGKTVISVTSATDDEIKTYLGIGG